MRWRIEAREKSEGNDDFSRTVYVIQIATTYY